GPVDEKSRDGAERTILQGDDAVWPAGHWQFNGQNLELRAPGEKLQCGSRKNCHKTAGRQETNPHMRRIGDYSHARIIEPAGAKGFLYDRPNHAFPRWQHPQFIHQFGNFDPVPPNPLILRARHDDIGVIKKKFEIQSLVSNRASAPYDQDRKSTRLNSSHVSISYAVFCLKK